MDDLCIVYLFESTTGRYLQPVTPVQRRFQCDAFCRGYGFDGRYIPIICDVIDC